MPSPIGGRWPSEARPDEGRVRLATYLEGNIGNAAPHQSVSRTASPAGEAFYASSNIHLSLGSAKTAPHSSSTAGSLVRWMTWLSM